MLSSFQDTLPCRRSTQVYLPAYDIKNPFSQRLTSTFLSFKTLTDRSLGQRHKRLLPGEEDSFDKQKVYYLLEQGQRKTGFKNVK